MKALNLKPPSPITAGIELADFDSGELSLNEWLKKRALKNNAASASRFVMETQPSDTTAYQLER